MPAACFEAQPDGQAKAFQAPWTQLWVLVAVPVLLLLSLPLWLYTLHYIPIATSTSTGLTLWPLWT